MKYALTTSTDLLKQSNNTVIMRMLNWKNNKAPTPNSIQKWITSTVTSKRETQNLTYFH